MLNILCGVILLKALQTTTGQAPVIEDKVRDNETDLDYLRLKWQLWHKMIDFNHKDGFTIDDEKLNIKEFIRISHLTGGKAENVSAALEQWWKENILSLENDRLTTEEFVNKIEDQFKTNKTAFVKWNANMASSVYNLYDIDDDGEFSEEEFVNGMKATRPNARLRIIYELFNAMNPHNEKLPIPDVIHYWVLFATDDDPSKDDPFRDVSAKELNITINK